MQLKNKAAAEKWIGTGERELRQLESLPAKGCGSSRLRSSICRRSGRLDLLQRPWTELQRRGGRRRRGRGRGRGSLRSAGTLTLRARQPASEAPRMATSSSGSSAPTSDSTARQLPAASFFGDSSSSSVYPLSPLAVRFSIFCSTATVD
uniref:Uncharacterized protein n=1 Tax=Setaria italica TaxID=4555 RepID=K3YK20_SETIT